MKRSRSRPPHPFLPPDSDRHIAITFVSNVIASGKLTELAKKLELPTHIATFRRAGHRVLITYTAPVRPNMQSSDWVNVGAPQAAGVLSL